MKSIQEFAVRVIQEYQDWPGYERMLRQAFLEGDELNIKAFFEEGVSLGRYFTVEQLQRAILNNHLEALAAIQKDLETIQRRQQLFNEWQDWRLIQAEKFLPEGVKL
jgi:hypothetical protein